MAASQLNRVLEHLRTILDRQDAAGMADADLVKRYVEERDEAAFEALLRRHGPMVLGVCRRVLRNGHDAEDAFQATFLVFVRKAPQLRSPGLVGNWLYGVAYRTALHAKNAAARRRTKEAAVVARMEMTEDPWAELRAVLDQALARLPERYRAVLILSDLEGKTRKEVARHLGLPEGTVASRLARGRSRLAKWLTRQGISVAGGTFAAFPQHATVSVPVSLLLSTAKSAQLMAAGRAAAMGVISTKVFALMEGVLQTMGMTKLKTLILLCLVLGLGIGTGMIAYPSVGQKQLGPKQAESKPVEAHALTEPGKPTTQARASERVDLTGDPLPEGAMARFGTVRFRLGNLVRGVAFGPEGKSLVACDWSGIYVWDARSGKELRRIGGDFQTHLGSCSFSADGKRLVICVTDNPAGTIQIWDVQTGGMISQFSAPPWSQVVLSADGNLVASCSQGNIHLRDIARGQELGQWTVKQKVFGSIALAPDGKTLVYGGEDKAIHVLEIATGKEIRRLPGHRDDIGSLLFSPNGRIVASVGLTTQEHNTPNGGRAIMGMNDNRVHLWDIDSGKELRQFVVPRQVGNDKPKGFSNGVGHVAFAHDGKRLAASTALFKDKHVRIWDVSTGEKVGDLPVFGGALAFSADDKILATSGTEAIQLWDSHSGKDLQVTKGHQGSILGLAVSPDSRLVASAGQDGTVRLWEPATGKELQRIANPEDGVHGVTFWPDGRTLAISGSDKAIRLWDLAASRETRRLQGDHEYWSTPTLSPDGKMVASCSSDGVICLWDSVTGKKQREWRAISTGYVGRLFFGPDSRTLYSWGNNQLRVWDTSTGQELRQFFAGQKDRTYAAAFAPNGKWLACGGQEPTILLYDLATGKEMHRLVGLPGAVSCLSFSADSRMLATAGWYGEPIVVWEMASKRERCRFSGHRSRINALAFSPDSRFLVSGSEDSTALVWDLLGSRRVPRQAGNKP